MLKIRNLYFRHQRNTPDILKGIRFAVRAGEMTIILGPNGSGKTTLFRCAAGLWKAQKGEILFEDRNISKLSCAQRARIFAVMPQEHKPTFPFTVFDIVLMGRASHISVLSSPGENDGLKTEQAMKEVGITHLRDRAYTQLSGGEKQLVFVARALAQEAPVLLLDEPTSHLDFKNQILVLKKVREIAKQRGLTVVMTLHDPNLALLFAEKVVLMNGGHVVSEGPPHDVITEENLKRIYGINVSLINWNGTSMVCPRMD